MMMSKGWRSFKESLPPQDCPIKVYREGEHNVMTYVFRKVQKSGSGFLVKLEDFYTGVQETFPVISRDLHWKYVQSRKKSKENRP